MHLGCRNHQQKTEIKTGEDKESIGGVCITYVKHLSEKVAREFRRVNAEVIYLPSQKIKDVLCVKSKDKVLDLDKAGVLYKVNVQCELPDNEKKCEDYIGETKYPTKHRMYEHHVVTRKESRP